ncbi:transposase [Tunturiibacter psychrotolerans]|uniref:transposase n=1 Tax=Tunturiibacter psychrotolerans TaxID=3069686 RepID=UPI003D1DECBD
METQIGSYLGLILCEDSSANRQRLGHITKQGSSLVRYLLAESAQAAVRLYAFGRRWCAARKRRPVCVAVEHHYRRPNRSEIPGARE